VGLVVSVLWCTGEDAVRLRYLFVMGGKGAGATRPHNGKCARGLMGAHVASPDGAPQGVQGLDCQGGASRPLTGCCDLYVSQNWRDLVHYNVAGHPVASLASAGLRSVWVVFALPLSGWS